jgi:hypothetical protein
MRIVKDSEALRSVKALKNEIRQLKDKLNLAIIQAAYRENKFEVNLWLSKNDTYRWANRIGSCWPCSQISGKSLFASFDKEGNLVDFAINGRIADVDSNEFNAITDDFIKGRFK